MAHVFMTRALEAKPIGPIRNNKSWHSLARIGLRVPEVFTYPELHLLLKRKTSNNVVDIIFWIGHLVSSAAIASPYKMQRARSYPCLRANRHA